MEFRQLRYFVAVAQELHFGKAAERLQITQPALSKQIRVLETELGIELFIRTKRSVKLTKVGEVFLVQAQQLLQQAAKAVKLAKRTALGEVGRLTIAFTATATYTVLPELIQRFRAHYPQVAKSNSVILCSRFALIYSETKFSFSVESLLEENVLVFWTKYFSLKGN